MYSVAFVWNFLSLSITSWLSKASFRACVSLWVSYLGDLSIAVSEVLMSPTMTVLLLIRPFKVVNSCLIYCGQPVLGA